MCKVCQDLTKWQYLVILPNKQITFGKTMNEQEKIRYTARAEVIKALAHPTRLFIVDQLTQGSRCVCELRDMIGADVSTVSKHLLLLKNAGLITSHKVGKNVHYELKCPCLNNFFACIENVLESNLKHHQETM